MPIRNPFARRAGAVANDENPRPDSAESAGAPPAFERVDTVGSKASSALSIRSARSQDTGEYKMSGASRRPRPVPAASLAPQGRSADRQRSNSRQ